MKKIFSLLPLLFSALVVFAQPANDDCAGIVNLGVVPFCNTTVFNNIGATASNIGNDNIPVSSSCLGITQPQNDVWFQFTASDTITDYRITVTGTGTPSLVNPLMILYRGDCLFDGLAEAGCSPPEAGTFETVLDAIGLTPGLDYFLRISDFGGAITEGNFTLCIKEIPPATDITQGSSTLCNGIIYDSGGADANYSADENFIFTICPSGSPACINFVLDYYNIETGYGDSLTFYDGPNTNSPIAASIFGNDNFNIAGNDASAGGSVCFQVQASSGCLTMQFISDENLEFEGFKGHWECSATPCVEKKAIVVNDNISNADIENFVADAATTVTITSVNCEKGSYGTFLAGDNTDLGLEKGLIMTSGSIENAAGQNTAGATTLALNSPGDADLDVMSINSGNGSLSRDACILELDVFVKTDQLTFEYVFGSEEYTEYVGGNFNDIFAFLVSGPGIVGDPGLNGQKNIAVLPNSIIPVQINSVNNLDNWPYYRNNENGFSSQYDGLTSDSLGIKKSLTARQYVTPCQTYHLKFAIADRGDSQLDSGVFIADIKGGAPSVEVAFANGIDYLSEFCSGQPDNLVIKLDNPSDQALTFNVVLGGTAIQGLDYTLNIPAQINFQAGISQVSFPIQAITDALVEGTETITVSLTKDYGCGLVILTTTTINIADQLDVQITAGDTALVCAGGTLQLEAVGAASWFWQPPGAVSNPNIGNPTITPANDISLIVTGTVGNCFDMDTVLVHIIAPTINVLTPTTNICLGQSVQLNSENNVNNAGLTWTPANSLSNSTILNPIATPTESTTYFASVEIAGCVVTDQVTINVDTMFFPKLTTLDTTICQNYSVDLGENIDPTTTKYIWTPSAGLSVANVSGPIATPDALTNYVLIATSANGYCTQTAAVNIKVIAADININGDAYREICLGDTIPLFANLSGTGPLVWSNQIGGIPNPSANPIKISPDESNWYFATFNINGCTVFDSVFVRVDSLPNQSLTLDPFKSVYCPGEKVLIKSPTYEPASFPGLEPDMGGIMWTPDNGVLTPDTLWNLVIETTDTTKFIRAIKNFGCVDTSFIIVNVFQPIMITTIVDKNNICPGETVNLSAIFVGNYEIEWEGGEVSDKKSKNPTATPTATTTYTAKFKGIPCESSNSVTVTVVAPPAININQDPKICLGSPVTLQFNNDPTIAWIWTGPNLPANPGATPTINPAIDGTYNVTATSSLGCTSVAKTVVDVVTAKVNLGPDLRICEELLNASLTATVTGEQGGNYAWTNGPGGSNVQQVGLFTGNNIQNVTVTYNYGVNCVAYDTIKITTLPGISVDKITINPNLLDYCQGAKVTALAATTTLTPTYTLNWFLNNKPLTGGIGDSIKLNLSDLGVNTIKVQAITAPNGCVGENFVVANTRECFGIPNVFTPDGDQLNDVFELWYEVGAITIEDLKIYDRWGGLVYNNDTPNFKWDGQINGKDAAMDVYIYKVKFRRPDGSVDFKSGDVTLIR
jgi:gliding motility-associated-like protein